MITEIKLKDFLNINDDDVAQCETNRYGVTRPQYEVTIWRDGYKHLNVYALYKNGNWYFNPSWSTSTAGGGGYPSEKYWEPTTTTKQDIIKYVLDLRELEYFNKNEVLNAIAEARQMSLF